MEQAFQNGQPEKRAKPFKMFKKRSMTSIASYQVSPHTARIFKENERLIDKYKQKKA
ncbi:MULTISPECIES: type II toxin-antitoxin system SpoIISB family antitoxin [Bacillus]|uniref:Stage II sporulation protein SB n=1 Tax=Bacillus amyloliquefaciens (strain Y2) TaxID=1155777 RepID=I2C3Z8_BACAY|nr:MULTISPECIES: type II toxin-antitoxin system SpoIISB family antitoxin [Bacillus]AFJ61372.1 stage II sporulation protein SB [Bacillus velezensis YAU B9601-Y2]AJE78298.1 stage II sporulation protein SB [Bacillus sp. BH072]AMQ73721.1 stage II sporulation protein SB [Bacillus amyloliquefaciens UMAF6614]AUG35380.1 stage II sporulation protein SB [Bacillus velezensis]AWM47597.1 stage II sporulation protein SB [Bacillus amyloliquefaciens]